MLCRCIYNILHHKNIYGIVFITLLISHLLNKMILLSVISFMPYHLFWIMAAYLRKSRSAYPLLILNVVVYLINLKIFCLFQFISGCVILLTLYATGILIAVLSLFCKNKFKIQLQTTFLQYDNILIFQQVCFR